MEPGGADDLWMLATPKSHGRIRREKRSQFNLEGTGRLFERKRMNTKCQIALIGFNQASHIQPLNYLLASIYWFSLNFLEKDLFNHLCHRKEDSEIKL